MRFDIRLVHNIEAHNVRECQKHRVGRIVRGADGVDVKLLHEPQVFFDIRRGHHIARHRVAVVVVYALHFDMHAVEFEHVAVDRNGLEARHIAYNGQGLPALFERQEQFVGFRQFGAPFFDRKIFKGKLCVGGCGFFLSCEHGIAVQKRCFERTAVFCAEHLGVYVQRVCPAVFTRCFDFKVVKIRPIQLVKQDVAENTRFAEHILTFEIRARAPAVHHAQQLIFTLLHKGVQVKFSSVVRALGIADRLAVYVYIQARRNA